MMFKQFKKNFRLQDIDLYKQIRQMINNNKSILDFINHRIMNNNTWLKIGIKSPHSNHNPNISLTNINHQKKWLNTSFANINRKQYPSKQTPINSQQKLQFKQHHNHINNIQSKSRQIIITQPDNYIPTDNPLNKLFGKRTITQQSPKYSKQVRGQMRFQQKNNNITMIDMTKVNMKIDKNKKNNNQNRILLIPPKSPKKQLFLQQSLSSFSNKSLNTCPNKISRSNSKTNFLNFLTINQKQKQVGPSKNLKKSIVDVKKCQDQLKDKMNKWMKDIKNLMKLLMFKIEQLKEHYQGKLFDCQIQLKDSNKTVLFLEEKIKKLLQKKKDSVQNRQMNNGQLDKKYSNNKSDQDSMLISDMRYSISLVKNQKKQKQKEIIQKYENTNSFTPQSPPALSRQQSLVQQFDFNKFETRKKGVANNHEVEEIFEKFNSTLTNMNNILQYTKSSNLQ